MMKFRSLVGETHIVPVALRGKRVLVEFSGGKYNNLRLGEFCTSDEELAKVLRSDAGFGRYWIEAGDNAAGTAVVVPPLPLREKVYRTVNEAKEWLVGLGCRASDVNSTAKAVAVAKEYGFDLKFKRNEQEK